LSCSTQHHKRPSYEYFQNRPGNRWQPGFGQRHGPETGSAGHRRHSNLPQPLNAADSSTFAAFFAQLTRALADTFDTDRFDFLINNAGTSLTAPIAETTEAQFDEMLNLHFKGVYFLTQKALPLLRDGGRIINISSATTRVAFAGSSAYASMKGAVEVFTRYLALELGSRGIAANVVAPGAVFGGGAMTDTPEIRAYVAQITALGRVAEPDDIGGLVAFLCTDAARWLNGQRLEATGGMML
jgi:NAD(P)-dependent dehydrogenase (short-subunit alcohol dehydrogenase family)